MRVFFFMSKFVPAKCRIMFEYNSHTSWFCSLISVDILLNFRLETRQWFCALLNSMIQNVHLQLWMPFKVSYFLWLSFDVLVLHSAPEFNHLGHFKHVVGWLLHIVPDVLCIILNGLTTWPNIKLYNCSGIFKIYLLHHYQSVIWFIIV